MDTVAVYVKVTVRMSVTSVQGADKMACQTERSLSILLYHILLLSSCGAKHFVGPTFERTFTTRLVSNASVCEILSSGWGQVHRLASTKTIVESKPQESFGDCIKVSESSIVSIFAPSEELARDELTSICSQKLITHPETPKTPETPASSAPPEITVLINSGPPENRIDVVMMGDGYTLDERDKWYSDVNRLVKDMFESSTFGTYLPLFNIWSVFQDSVQSGIGSNGRPLNTAFGLYRDGTELRGV